MPTILMREITRENWRATLLLSVHPDNSRAQQLYIGLGFRPDGRERWGELVYSLPIQQRDDKMPR